MIGEISMGNNKRKLISELLNDMGIHDIIDKLMKDNLKYMGRADIKNLPINHEEIIDNISDVYDNLFTKKNIEDLIKLLSTELGKKIADIHMSIIRSTIMIVNSHFDKMMDKILHINM